jgi:hypothetical protein
MIRTMCWKLGTRGFGASVGGADGVSTTVGETGTGVNVDVAEGIGVSVGTGGGGNGPQATSRTKRTIQNLERDMRVSLENRIL